MYSKITFALIVAGLLVTGIGIFNSSVSQAAPPCVEYSSADLATNPELLKINCGEVTDDAKSNVQRAFEASAARYSAMAAYYADAKADRQRANAAISTRYHGLAQFFTVADVTIDSNFLASNPELSVVRRYDMAEDVSDSHFWAANPELMSVNRYTAQAK